MSKNELCIGWKLKSILVYRLREKIHQDIKNLKTVRVNNKIIVFDVNRKAYRPIQSNIDYIFKFFFNEIIGCTDI